MITYNFIHYESVDSTNSEIKRLCHQGACEGTVVIAASQTAGRGRLGRRWISPPGNLYFTILLKPRIPLDILSQLSLVTGIALAKTIQYYINKSAPVSLKWPNDIMINRQKVAGILIETDIDVPFSEGIPCYLGIGVNIENSPDLTVYPAISLKDIVAPAPTASEFLENFTEEFNSVYSMWLKSGFMSLKEEWLSFAHGLGEIAVATSGKDGQITGKFITISDAGSMCLVDEEGKEHIISSSEVTF